MVKDKIEQFEKNLKKEKKGKKKKKKLSEEAKQLREKKLKKAKEFKDKVLEKYKKIVKAVVIFGSLTRADFHSKSDIDMLVIIDNTASKFSPEMKKRFDQKIRTIGKDVSKNITVQPAWTLTEFWDMARMGHPLLYTIVRDGWALYDTGFFIPVRKLLEKGKIPTTLEAVEKFMQGAPKKLKRAKNAKMYIIAEDLYYSMLNSSQAVLMYLGETVPAPKHTPDVVKKHLVETDLLEEEYLGCLKEVLKFRKSVEHKEINSIDGKELDDFIKKTDKYVDRMEQLLTKLKKEKKANTIKKNYETMIKASVAALKSMDKLPEDPKELPKAIKAELIEKKKINPLYERVLQKALVMRKLLDENKENEIPEKDVHLTMLYVRRYVKALSPLIDKKALKKESKKFKCDKCDKEFDTEKGLNIHKSLTHK